MGDVKKGFPVYLRVAADSDIYDLPTPKYLKQILAKVPFNIRGMVAPVFTPLNEDQSINCDVIPAYLDYLASHDVKAILFGGTTGEAPALSVAERKRLTEVWSEEAKIRNMKIMVQVGGAPLPDVLVLAAHAEQLQADAILTLPELYFKPRTADQLVSYLQRVSAAAPTLPILYYHFPGMTCVNVNIKEFFTLACSRIPNFRGLKGDLEVGLQVADQLHGDRMVFIANHHLATSAFMGFNSSIATVNNLYPKLVAETLEAVRSSNLEKAKGLQKKLIVLTDGVASHGEWVPTTKYAMQLICGLKMGPPRAPLTPLSLEQKASIERHLKKNDVEVKGNI